MSGRLHRQTLDALVRAAGSRDPDAVERAVSQAFRQGLAPDFVPVLVDLLGMPWHFRHEDVARALQELKDARAVEPLYRAASACHGYLDYDDSFSLARKCVWGLADI